MMNAMRNGVRAAVLAALAMIAAGGAHAAEEAGAEKPAKPTPYPLAVCVVTSETLGGEGSKPFIYAYEGRELRFTSEDCVAKFEADAAGYIEKIDAAIIAQQKDHYPVTTCLVSDEPLDVEGEPRDVVVDNRLVRVCCPGCIKELKADPAKFLKALDEAIIKAGSENYPIDYCIVSEDPLGNMGEPANVIVAGRLVKICCPGCSRALEREPAKFIALLDAAAAAKAEGAAKPE